MIIDMYSILIMIAFVILSPGLIIITILFWTLVGNLVDILLGKINPPAPPYCDIDPRCHIAFMWHQDGTGWVRDIKVIDGLMCTKKARKVKPC